MSESNNERRGLVRHPFRWELGCELLGPTKAERRAACIHDISPEGLGLVLSEALASGAVLEVVLSCPEESLSYKLPLRVCHSKPQGDGTWLIGCTFINDADYRAIAEA